MSRINLFLDSSALIAGLISAEGASRALLLLGEDEKLQLTVSEQVIAEIERNLARKAPRAAPFAREMIRVAKVRILRDPAKDEVSQRMDWIGHAADAPILVAAYLARVDFLVTLNRRHFPDDPEVARQSGLRIGVPEEALRWVREQLEKGDRGSGARTEGRTNRPRMGAQSTRNHEYTNVRPAKTAL
jgi:predicted nucleic acid-binding protein